MWNYSAYSSSWWLPQSMSPRAGQTTHTTLPGGIEQIVAVYDLSPYSALIQSFWGWCFKRHEWVWQKILLSLLVVVVRISISCFTGTQELLYSTQAGAIGKKQCRDYSKIYICLVHIVGYWVQSYLTLPEMSEKFSFLVQNIKCKQKQFCWLQYID